MADTSLFATAVEGFLLAIGIIVAIGPQNAFVLRQGLRKQHVFALATACALSDIVLIAAGVAGLGSLVRATPAALTAIGVGGAIFLFAHGALALRRMLSTESLHVNEGEGGSLAATLTTGLALTFLNPHVYLDTVVLIGGLSARHPGAGAIAFGIGAGVASTSWFYGLGYGARLLVPLFAKPIAWRVLDGIIVLLMWGIAASLVVELAVG